MHPADHSGGSQCSSPYGCSKTIYLCDDGKDREKQEWMKALGPGYVYVSGRTRAKGESNGKSGNLNNVFAQIYPADHELDIPGNEVLCIFDADQVGFLCQVKLMSRNDLSPDKHRKKL